MWYTLKTWTDCVLPVHIFFSIPPFFGPSGSSLTCLLTSCPSVNYNAVNTAQVGSQGCCLYPSFMSVCEWLVPFFFFFNLPLTERRDAVKKEQIRASRRAVAAQQPPACRSQAEVNETVCQGGFGREKVSDNEQMSLIFFFAWEKRKEFNLHCTQNPRDVAGRRQI